MKKFLIARLAGFALVAGLLAVHVFADDGLESLRARTFDIFQQIQPREAVETPVVLIRIDDASLAKYGRWPWNRALIADLVKRTAGAGAVVIGLDILFPESDAAASGVSSDWILADAIGEATTVLAVSLGQGATPHEAEPKSGWSVVGNVPDTFPGFPGLVASLPEFNEPATGLGVIRAIPDADGVLRELPVVWVRAQPQAQQAPNSRNVQIWPSFALELIRIYAGAENFVVRMNETGFDALRIAGTTIDLLPSGGIRLWESNASPPRVSAVDILDENSAVSIPGAIAIITVDAVGLADFQVTPTRPARPGAELHALLVEQMIAGRYLRDGVQARWIERGWFVLAALSILLLSGFLARKVLLGFVFISAVMVLPFAAAAFAYVREGLLYDPLQPAAGIVLIAAFEGYSRYRDSEARREMLTKQFGQFLSPAVVQQLIDTDTEALLGGEKREITILMTDIRGFTNLSEKLEADRLIEVVNHFLSIASDEILFRDGTIDKFMGDAVLAFWNAPIEQENHRQLALDTAIALIKRVREGNSELAARGLDPIHIGVGVESGVCSVGNFGSARRFDYTAVGSPVNRAARIESVTKKLGIPLVLGPEFANAAPVEIVQAGAFELQGIEGKTPVFTTPEFAKLL